MLGEVLRWREKKLVGNTRIERDDIIATVE